jgi:serine protease AprX
VVTVGAADPVGTVSRGDDGMASWSSYGLTQDLHSKPDVVAPGRYITAAMAADTAYLAQKMPDRIVDRHYLWLSGTSMAAPVVAGVAALIFQAHPEWTNDQVKWLLGQTATVLHSPAILGLVSTPLLGQGSGEVDAAAAVHYKVTPSRANQGLLINLQLTGPDSATHYTASSSSSSWSSSSWSSSSWSSSSWSSSSWSSSSWSSSSWSSAEWASLEELE